MDLFISILVQALFSLFAGLVGAVVVLALRGSRRGAAAAGVLCCVIAAILMTWFAHREATSLQVQITEPKNGADVGSRPLVKGTSSNGAEVYLLVRPLNGSTWWVQDRPAVDRSGEWQVAAYLGTDSVGRGESFEIIAVSASGSRLIRLVQEGAFSTGQQMTSVPAYVGKSNRVVVRRVLP